MTVNIAKALKSDAKGNVQSYVGYLREARERKAMVDNIAKQSKGKLDIISRVLTEALRGFGDDAQLSVWFAERWMFTLSNMFTDDEKHGIKVTIGVPVDGLKDAALVTALEVLENNGIQAYMTNDDAAYMTRTYRLFTRFDRTPVELNIEARVRGDSETCHRVEDGIEVVEKPRYKLVCN